MTHGRALHPGASSVMQPAYPAARAAAPQIRDHFARHLSTLSPQQSGRSAAAPDTAAIEAIIEAAFWASLRREEGYVPRISLAFVAPEMVTSPLKFERRLPLAAQPLTRLAPAVERPGIHLGVWRDGEQFFVWGATRDLPAFCLVLEVIAPGLLVVKHSRDESEKFVNVAVLQGDEIKIIDEQSCEPAGLSGPPDVAARVRYAALLQRIRERAHTSRGLDARPWPRRLATGRALENGAVAGVGGAASLVRPRAAVLRACRADAGTRCREPGPPLGECAPARGRRCRRPYRGGWRHRDHRPVRGARVRRQDRSPPRDRRRSPR